MMCENFIPSLTIWRFGFLKENHYLLFRLLFSTFINLFFFNNLIITMGDRELNLGSLH